jgi:hypothetical protein
MPVIENLMARWGFVKLSRYGLVLTPEGRIISMRPAKLGGQDTGQLVGWREDDFPALDLSSWDASPQPQPVPPARPVAVVPRVATLSVAARSVPTPAAPVLASEAEEPEDDWEWEIALARARVAAEEVEQAAARMTAPRRRGDTVPPPIAAAKPARPPTVKPPPVPAPKQAAAPVTLMIPSKSEPIAMISRIVEAAEAAVEDTVRTAPLAPKTRPMRSAAIRNEDATEEDTTRPDPLDATKPYATDATRPYVLSEGTNTRVAAAAKLTKTAPLRVANPTREAPQTTPMRAVAPKTAPMRAVDEPTRDTAPMATVPERRSTRTMPMPTVAPQTVIPVPALPRVGDGYRSAFAPVVRTSSTPAARTSSAVAPTSSPPRRFATGTQPVAPKTAAAAPKMSPGVAPKTSPGIAVDPDPTSPSVTPVALPGVTPRR